MRLTRTAPRSSITLLLLGDVLALVTFILVGLANHKLTNNLLADLVRIGAPFLAGWFISASLLRAYSPALLGRPGAFFLRSALAWVVGMSLGLLLRNTVFGDDFSRVFSIITFVFTGVFLLSWRALFAWRISR